MREFKIRSEFKRVGIGPEIFNRDGSRIGIQFPIRFIDSTIILSEIIPSKKGYSYDLIVGTIRNEIEFIFQRGDIYFFDEVF